MTVVYTLNLSSHAVARLRHAIPEVTGSITNGVIGIFHSFRPHCGPGVDSASNRNEHQEYFLWGKRGRYVGLTTLPPSCVECLEIWEPQHPGTLRACSGLYSDCFYPSVTQSVKIQNRLSVCLARNLFLFQYKYLLVARLTDIPKLL